MNTQNANKPSDEAAAVDADIIEQTPRPSRYQHLRCTQTWLRAVFMLLFVVLLNLVAYVMIAVVILQFIWSLFTGEINQKLRDFAWTQARYCYQILLFLSYNTDDKPFPFADWPHRDASS